MTAEGKNAVVENPDEGFGDVLVPQEGGNIIDLDLMLRDNQPSPRVRAKRFQKALLVLNQAIEHAPERFQRLWRGSAVVVCADGGANRLFSYVRGLVEQGAITKGEEAGYVPDLIVGDLDSLRDDVREYYASRGTIVKKHDSQYATDFSKCIAAIELYFAIGEERADRDRESTENSQRSAVKDAIKDRLRALLFTVSEHDGIIGLSQARRRGDIEVIVRCIGAIGGRFDHTVQMMSLLYKYHQANSRLHLVLVNTLDTVFFVPRGDNYIVFANDHCNCGLLPVYEALTLTTAGLKWDVTNWNSAITGSVSSSNRIVARKVFRVASSGPLVINIETLV